MIMPLLLLLLGCVAPDDDTHLRDATDAVARLGDENRRLRRLVKVLEDDAGVVRLNTIVGRPVHFTAFDLLRPPADAHLHDFAWNFGDDSAETGGFNTAHAYTSPGDYLVRLDGRAHARVTVRPDARPVLTALDARELAELVGRGGNVVRLPPGVVHLPGSVRVAPDTDVVGHDLGSTVLWTGPRGTGPMFQVDAGPVTLRNLTFTSIHDADYERGAPDVLRPGGGDVAVIGCGVGHIDTLVNGNRKPARVAIFDCRAEDPTSLRGYLAWVQGTQWVLRGNVVANSTREHVVRASDFRGLAADGNSLANIDRRDQGDPTDTAKGAFTIQKGELFWAGRNRVAGPSGFGPLGRGDGLRDPDARSRFGVYRDNTTIDGMTSSLIVVHGAGHVRLEGNVMNGPPDAPTFITEDTERDYPRDRVVSDLVVRGNTFVSPVRGGWVVRVTGTVRDRFVFEDNTLGYIAGALDAEAPGWAEVPLVMEGGRPDYYRIAGNVVTNPRLRWPGAQFVARFGHKNDRAAYVTADGVNDAASAADRATP